MAQDPDIDLPGNTFKLRGTARQVASFTTAIFLLSGLVATGIDLAAANRWDPATLQTWTLAPQVLSVLGLLVLGRWWGSRSFDVLAVLIGFVVVEEAFHILNPVSAWLAKVADIENSWTTLRLSILNGALTYGLVALLGITLLVVSHRRGSPAERVVVRNLAIMLFLAGFFAGPLATVSSLGSTRSWIFLEECGEAIVFAFVVGYIAGLVTLAHRSGTSSPSSRVGVRRRRTERGATL